MPSYTNSVKGTTATYDTIDQTIGSAPAYTQLTQAVINGKDLLTTSVPTPNSGPANWLLSSSTSTNRRRERIRVDQNVSDKTSVFVRYTHDAWNTLAVPSLWAWASFDTTKTPFDGPEPPPSSTSPTASSPIS